MLFVVILNTPIERVLNRLTTYVLNVAAIVLHLNIQDQTEVAAESAAEVKRQALSCWQRYD